MAVITFELPNGETVTMIEDGDRTAVHERNGGFERASLALWCSWVERGRGYVDVGAYTGLYSMIACRLGGAVLAIEPLPEAVRRIRANASLNGLAPFIASGAASDHTGKLMLRYNGGMKLTSGGSISEGHARTHNVEVLAFEIDALASDSDVAAMKIDVEGHELAVLRGATQTIKRCRPKLLVETLTQEAREAVHAFLPSYREAGFLDGRNTVYIPT